MTEVETDAGPLVDPYGVASGVLGGAMVLFLQVWVYSVVGDLIRVPAGTEPPVAEMAVFLALGVVLPAGGVALLASEATEAGVAAGVTLLLGVPLVDLAFATPPWQVSGLAIAIAVLVVVGVLARTSARRSPETGW